jgi:hypothetical protein
LYRFSPGTWLRYVDAYNFGQGLLRFPDDDVMADLYDVAVEMTEQVMPLLGLLLSAVTMALTALP